MNKYYTAGILELPGGLTHVVHLPFSLRGEPPDDEVTQIAWHLCKVNNLTYLSWEAEE